MTRQKYSYEELIEKMVRAKISLEKVYQSHTLTCHADADPEGITPCNCGASKNNSDIAEAMESLKL